MMVSAIGGGREGGREGRKVEQEGDGGREKMLNKK